MLGRAERCATQDVLVIWTMTLDFPRMGNETMVRKRTRKRFPRSEPADLPWLILLG
jgi:hypothetical protein